MKTIFNIGKVLLVGLCITTVACSSDYLDTMPTDKTAAETAVSTTDNAYKALNGVAKIMMTQHAFYGQGFAGENAVMILTEEYPGPYYMYNGYAAGWANLHNMKLNDSKNTRYNVYNWGYYYQIISNANTIIGKIDAATGAEADKKFIKASALTFRAFAYEKLARYYGKRWKDSAGKDESLVLRLDDSTTGMKLSTTGAVYDQIYADLDQAITLFTESGKDRESGQFWIPNANVAHAVYARTALVKEDYAKALSEAKLARNGYALMSNADYVAGFCKPTSEWIFGGQNNSQEQLWYWAYGTQRACNGYYAGKYSTGAGALDIELLERIPDADVRKSLFLTKDKFPTYDFTQDSILEKTYALLGTDATYKVTAKALYNAVKKYCDDMTPSGLTKPYQAGVYYLGGQLKFWALDLPGVGNLPFIRSSEMLLIEAEANYFLNNTADAVAALVELNKTSGRNPNYATSNTGDALFAEIRDYRALELFGEGFSWSDYKRWKLPFTRKTVAQGSNAHPAVAITIDVTHANDWIWITPEPETLYNDQLNPATMAP